MLDDEKLHPLQVASFRRMSPTEKHQAFLGLVRLAREVKRSSVRQQHPEMNQDEVDRIVARLLLHGHA